MDLRGMGAVEGGQPGRRVVGDRFLTLAQAFPIEARAVGGARPMEVWAAAELIEADDLAAHLRKMWTAG